MIVNAPDLYGLVVPRFPTQVIGILWGVIALGMVWAMRARRWPAGARGVYALSLVALGAFFLGFTRGDPMPLVGGFRLDVIGSALTLVAASVAWGWLVSRPPRADAPRRVSTPDSNANP
jgi:prolipoprotein diacylglyceryltransferase